MGENGREKKGKEGEKKKTCRKQDGRKREKNVNWKKKCKGREEG